MEVSLDVGNCQPSLQPSRYRQSARQASLWQGIHREQIKPRAAQLPTSPPIGRCVCEPLLPVPGVS